MLLTVPQDLIRISVGTEHIDDILADFEQSFKASATAPKKDGAAENADATGNPDAPTKPVV